MKYPEQNIKAAVATKALCVHLGDAAASVEFNADSSFPNLMHFDYTVPSRGIAGYIQVGKITTGIGVGDAIIEQVNLKLDKNAA